MILSRIALSVDTKKRVEILEILLSFKMRTEMDQGCLSCRIYEESRNEELITYEEVWKTEEYLRHHIRSPHYRNLLAAMDLASKPPDVNFYTISNRGSMEFIEKALVFIKKKEM